MKCEHGIEGCLMPGWHLPEECHTAEMADYLAREYFNTCNDDGGYLEHDPEDAADEEMSYWTD